MGNYYRIARNAIVRPKKTNPRCKQALVMFLLKLKSANSNKMIAAILQSERKQLVSDYTASIMSLKCCSILLTS